MGGVSTYLVLGTEDSGGKAWARILLRATNGYREEAATYFDAPVWSRGKSPIVVHRSYPHAGDFFPIEQLLRTVPKPIGAAIVVVRGWWPTMKAQVARNRVRTPQESLENQRRGLGIIYYGLWMMKVPTYTVTYEDPRIVVPTLDALGLSLDGEPPYWDGNKWWYEGNTAPMTQEDA